MGKIRKIISVVVPVFNEEKTVKKVFETLLKSSLINEIIAVNDGSTDKSLDLLRDFKKQIKLISYKKNHGKGYALAQGLKKAKNEIVIFLDSDLVGLSVEHVQALLSPFNDKRIKAVLGYSMPRKNHFFAKSFISINVTGQRSYYKKDLLPHLGEIAKTKYGVEIFLNSLFKRKETKKIPLINLTHVWTYQKYKPHKALRQYFKLGTEIAKEVGKTKFKEYKQTSNNGLKLVKKEINDKLLAKGFNPLFYWSLVNYYYKKLDLKNFLNYLFKE